jgi:hypothetical protein
MHVTYACNVCLIKNIYIYTERERERERQRQGEKGRKRERQREKEGKQVGQGTSNRGEMGLACPIHLLPLSLYMYIDETGMPPPTLVRCVCHIHPLIQLEN